MGYIATCATFWTCYNHSNERIGGKLVENIMKHSVKQYKCTQCGYITTQTTNHYGHTWSFGRMNCCPQCPPYKKYPEYGGQTIWECKTYTIIQQESGWLIRNSDGYEYLAQTQSLCNEIEKQFISMGFVKE